MFNWLFNRALRLSHATTVKLAKLTGQTPETISNLNDIAAGFVAEAASKATGG